MIFRLSPVVLLLLNFFAISYVGAAGVERVIWDKRPIPVILAVGQERLIHFQSDVRYWVPETLQDVITVLAANGVLYIQSDQPFIKTRIRVQDVETQRIYLLDIVSQEGGDYSQDIVVTPKSDIVSMSNLDRSGNVKEDWPIKLMRFAAQSLYAPERLSPTDKHIRRVLVNTEPVGLLRGGDTESKAIGQWQGGGLYVTAVLVRNLTNRSVEIAPIKKSSDRLTDVGRTIYLSDDVRGEWLSVAAQHSVLYPAGEDADRTCFYLVSHRPFGGSL